MSLYISVLCDCAGPDPAKKVCSTLLSVAGAIFSK